MSVIDGLLGAHVLIYSRDADADRAFFRDILGFKYVDVGHGWLIFGLPPGEVAVHPLDGGTAAPRHAGHEILTSHVYLMCEDLKAFMAALAKKKVECTEIETELWGIRTTIRLPSGGELGLYQPTHKTALDL